MNINTGREPFNQIAEVLVQGLKQTSVSAKIEAKSSLDYNRPDCFDSISVYEITGENGKKIVGSAQKVLKSAIIQQGSIQIPEISGEFGRSFLDQLIVNISEAFQLLGPFQDYQLRDEDLSACHRLSENRYQSREWNARK
jgi:lipoate-protein ligase A